MNPNAQSMSEIWVYLASSPLLWLTLTLVVYQFAMWLHRRLDLNPLANPVLIGVSILVGILQLTDTSYQTYFDGAKFVHFLLGPATVALAVPLYAQLARLKSLLLPLLGALILGSLCAVLSAVVIGAIFGASDATLLSLAPKSVTTPIAMGVAERIGGIPSLAVVFVLTTGVIGAIGARWLFKLMGEQDHAIQGFAIGIAAHGIGTARALQISEQAGAFSALAMGLNGMLTATLLPVLVPWLRVLF